MDTTNNQMFRPDGEGGYLVSPAGVLLLAADALYGDPAETTPAGRQNASAVIEAIMAAAVVGGYKQKDIFLTLLEQSQRSPRVIEMAQAACDAVDPNTMVEIITRWMK
jgi:hypothetical protein